MLSTQLITPNYYPLWKVLKSKSLWINNWTVFVMSKLFSTGIVLNRLTNIVNPDLHYIESFGRVRKLSLKTVKMYLWSTSVLFLKLISAAVLKYSPRFLLDAFSQVQAPIFSNLRRIAPNGKHKSWKNSHELFFSLKLHKLQNTVWLFKCTLSNWSMSDILRIWTCKGPSSLFIHYVSTGKWRFCPVVFRFT